jgi:hypothetical protein
MSRCKEQSQSIRKYKVTEIWWEEHVEKALRQSWVESILEMEAMMNR